MRLVRTLLATAGVAALVGCGAARNTESVESQCTHCHGGTDNETGAPPLDLAGHTDPGVLTVGRHSAHLAAGVACDACHPARTQVTMAGHLDGKVDVAFSGVAAAQGATPAFDARTGTCSGVYCHGATLGAGGARPALVWNGTLGEPRCAQCHGFPPPAPHPQLATCSSCHAATVDAAGALLPGGAHLNGVVDAPATHPAGYGVRSSPAFHGPDAIAFLAAQPGAVACAGCHGADLGGGVGPSCTACHEAAGWTSPAWTANCTFCHGTRTPAFDAATQLRLAAPPEGVGGETTGPHVGAHQKHLAPTRAGAVACATCHSVPAQASPLAHLDGTAAVALTGLGAGTYAPATQTCSTYCHSSLPGAPARSPAWTTPGPLACDACHGAPPATGRHPGNESKHAFMGTNCGICHAGIAGALPAIVDPSRHVNGAKDVSLSIGSWDGSGCATACHGTLTPFPWAR